MSRIGSAVAALAALVGCAPAGEVDVEPRSQALEGRIISAEFALDAPWRLEPEVAEPSLCLPPCTGGPSYRYGAVPVVVSVRDTYRDPDPIWEIRSVDVHEVGTGFSRHFELDDFHEIEFTRGEWLPTPGFELPDLNHTLCRRWQGQSCAGAGANSVMRDASEWDGLLFYEIQQARQAGKDVRLRVVLNVRARRHIRHPSDPNQWTYRFEDDQLDNEVVVHLGDAPLPRFDGRWAYGDLHYHSYGTDNEGESGYGHRATLHAIGAIGLDFVFATEHASNSPQFNLVDQNLRLVFNSLRDMSPQKFRQLLGRLNQPGGANREVTSYRRLRNPYRYAVPQLFLGGEADAFPEVSPEEAARGTLTFGSGQSYQLDTCGVVGSFSCSGLSELLEPTTTLGGQPRFIVKDLQGINADRIKAEFFLGALLKIDSLAPEWGRFPARQHLVHLPDDPERADAFVASNTTRWGGGNRRLEELLDTEYTRGRKGVAFLAHPVDTETEKDGTEKRGVMRLGPDIVPYSEAQLADAFKNEHMLGLEAWNEDVRQRTSKDGAGIINSADGLTPFQSPTNTTWEYVPYEPLLFSSLHRGVAAWDRMLRWGIDPTRTRELPWLASGRPRRVYFAAGSDAHGDLNYRRAGYMFGVNEINDTALGKPRNLLFVGNPAGAPLVPSSRPGPLVFGANSSPFTQRQVVEALRAGQFTATDGPALRIAIDVNGNGAIDDGDIPMGGELTWWRGPVSLPIVVEWISTPEFGPVETIELVVGAHATSLNLGQTFAPARHGVRMNSRDPRGVPLRSYALPNGGNQVLLDDGYWQDPTGALRVSIPASEGLAGRRTITLSPSQFLVGRPVARTSQPCTVRPPCNKPGAGNDPLCWDVEPDADCGTTYHYESPTAPDRLYVRAFAKTKKPTQTRTREVCTLPPPCNKPTLIDSEQCLGVEPICRTETYEVCTQMLGCFPRFAYANPVWASQQNPTFVTPIGGAVLSVK